MKKILFFLLVIPVFGLSQAKTVVSVNRVFPKVDKIAEFEKGLAAHAQKYHKGDWTWRVFEIQSGPDAGGYHLTEGPTSWASFDGRGDLGAEHTNDWNKSVAIYLTDRGSASYSQFEDSLSTVTLSDYSDKITITHIVANPGLVVNLRGMIQKMKKPWMLGNESVAVYSSVASGEPEFAIVTRLKGGLKELDATYRKSMPERFNEANGAGAWDQYLKDYSVNVKQRWTELLFVRKDLSSK